jgi:hypothetical protein
MNEVTHDYDQDGSTSAACDVHSSGKSDKHEKYLTVSSQDATLRRVAWPTFTATSMLSLLD